MEEKQNELPQTPPPTLNYSTGRYEKKPYSLVGEMLLGFGVWVGGEILVAGLLLSMVNAGGYEYWAWILPGIAVLIVIWMSILSYTRWHMRGFLPGILLGLGLTCLVPIGIVYAYCGNGF